MSSVKNPVTGVVTQKPVCLGTPIDIKKSPSGNERETTNDGNVDTGYKRSSFSDFVKELEKK